ncbi:hypothetical protein NMG60_11029629 [Bertholletia excelsa]
MSIVEEARDQVSIEIDRSFYQLSHISSQPYIFKVYERVRRVNKKAYEPEVLAIGPYHRGNPKLKRMEGEKLRYLQQLLRRRNEDGVDQYVKAMRNVEKTARGCYAEHISLSPDKFIEMLVLDGCFIIELFRRHAMPELRDRNDIYFQTFELLFDIIHDLMLVENQLPFFVLTTLFDMTKSEDPRDNIISAALDLLTDFVPCEVEEYLDECDDDIGDIKHLVCLVHKCWCSPFARILSKRDLRFQAEPLELIRSATELTEAGVKFKKVEGRTLFDIRFSKGVMEMPCLPVGDETDFVARNLIAYEQYLPNDGPNYVTDYFAFIDCLVNSSKDVELLREEGIIDNWLGDNETVVTVFNKICNDVSSPMNLYYVEIFCQVNKHCRKRVNRWIANLNHNYFNTPWASISVIVAAVLLLLTVAQTVLSIVK